MTESEFDGIIDNLIETEGMVPVLNISGGEPFMHHTLGTFLKNAARKDVVQTSVSTNGLLLLKNKACRDLMKETGSIVALQFDGFSPLTYTTLRGRDLSAEKMKLIEVLEDEGINYSLVATIARGINENEIQQITDFFFTSKAITLMFQPIAFTG
jgi:uncharacterized radical SAM superfamily Fe-S cluster-containing enzyme